MQLNSLKLDSMLDGKKIIKIIESGINKAKSKVRDNLRLDIKVEADQNVARQYRVSINTRYAGQSIIVEAVNSSVPFAIQCAQKQLINQIIKKRDKSLCKRKV